MTQLAERTGEIFQRETKYRRGQLSGGAGWIETPERYKDYPGATLIELPRPQPPQASLHDAIAARHSVRDFSDKALSIGELSYLLWASTGIRDTAGGYEFRTAPSAGALYPIETYLVANNVADVPHGVYHYSVSRHSLEQLASGDHGARAAQAALDQEMCAECAVTFIWTAIFARSGWKYGQRAYRYVYLDAGHIAENLALAAAALGLGSCQIGALYDDEVNALLGVDGERESVLYMSAVGYPAH